MKKQYWGYNPQQHDYRQQHGYDGEDDDCDDNGNNCGHGGGGN